MNKVELINEWWTQPGQGDQSMEDEHHEFWDKILAQVIDVDIAGKTVLDFGCNQGGFLRKMYDRFGFKEAVGVDLAQKSVEVANARKGTRPVTYKALTNLDQFDGEFDVATSTAVIYLIHDIKSHAKQMFRALKSGGVYYATHPDYPSNPSFESIKTTINKHGAIKMTDYTLDVYADAFAEAGFKLFIKRIQPLGYMSTSKPNAWFSTVLDHVNFEYMNSYVFKLVKP